MHHPVVTASSERGPREIGHVGPCLRSGNIVVWPARHTALVGYRRVALTKGESAMLLAMMAADGEPVSRSTLGAVLGYPVRRAGSRSVDTRIYALRKKLGDDARDPELIVTVSGVGYAIRVDLEAEARGVVRPSDGVWERTTGEGPSRYTRRAGTPRSGVA
jgi:DNA-binding response OmpR family regulator